MHNADHDNGSGISVISLGRNRRALDWCLWVVTPIVVVATAATADAAPRVLVWSEEPTSAAVKQAGFEAVDFSPIASRLQAQRDAARDAERDVLGAVQTGLAEVKQAYLEQKFDDMVARLTSLETESVPILSRPEHVGVLWEIEFQLGLAYQARAGNGDSTRARERFELALALDAERRPLKDLYGPGVVTAFADAVAAHAAKTPRPVALDVAPGDARVSIDGVAVVDSSRPRNLRAGVHVVRGSAPGYESYAALVAVGADGDLRIALVAAPNRDADATPDTASGQAAIRASASRAGAAAVVFVQKNPATGLVRIQVVTADAVSARVSTVGQGLELLAPDGTLRVEQSVDPLVPRPPGATPVYKKWWFWTAIGAVAISAVAVGLATSDDPAHLLIFGPGQTP